MKTEFDHISGQKNQLGPHRVDIKNWLSCAPFEQLLNMEIDDISAGRATLSMPFLAKYCQGLGLLHGGALTSLADTAVAFACKSLLAEGTFFATVSLTSTFLAPVRQGIVTAHAQVVFSGERSLDGKAMVVDSRGREVMSFTSLFRVSRRNHDL